MQDKIKYWCNCYEDIKKYVQDKIDYFDKELNNCDDEEMRLYMLNAITTYKEVLRQMRHIEIRNN